MSRGIAAVLSHKLTSAYKRGDGPLNHVTSDTLRAGPPDNRLLLADRPDKNQQVIKDFYDLHSNWDNRC